MSHETVSTLLELCKAALCEKKSGETAALATPQISVDNSQDGGSMLGGLASTLMGLVGGNSSDKVESADDAHESALSGLQSTLMGLLGNASAKTSSSEESQDDADESSAGGHDDPAAFLGGCKEAVEQHLGGLGIDVSSIMTKLETAVLRGVMSGGQKQVKDAIGGMIGNLLKGGK